VTPAAKLQVLNGGFTTHRVGLDVVELDKGPLRTASAWRPNERTRTQVAHPYGALHVSWDAPRVLFGLASYTRPTGGRELPSSQLGEEAIESPVENHGVVTRWDRVAEHVLRQL
jgi:hypothetical protein